MKRLLVPVFGAVALGLAGCFTNPVTGRQELVAISPQQELSLGAQSFADVQKAEKVSQDPAANERVRRVGQRIAQAVGNDLPNAQWEFIVFDSDQVNAFALPGGHVGVYTGLLRLATTDDELAVVMGHEIGHVIARHGAERMTEAMAAQGLGQLGSALLEAKGTSPQLMEAFKAAYPAGFSLVRGLPHSRAQEAEADHMGVIYAARAGYDPRAAITFWQKMIAQKSSAAGSGIVQTLLSDHPADQDRITALQALMPEAISIYEQNRGRYPGP
jgi:predicted Zn-dependent protease